MSWRQAVVVLTAVALVACYAPTLRGMFEQWSNDEDMSHGFLVPIVILWLADRPGLYQRRVALDIQLGFAKPGLALRQITRGLLNTALDLGQPALGLVHSC